MKQTTKVFPIRRIIAIICSAVFILLLLVGVVIFLKRHKKTNKLDEETETEEIRDVQTNEIGEMDKEMILEDKDQWLYEANEL